VFENRVLRRIFEPNEDEILVTGSRRKLRNEELHNSYSSPHIIRGLKKIRWAGNVAHMDENRNAYRVLVGKPQGNTPLRICRRRLSNNIKMDI
jgi:hypothetical protein